MLKLGIIREEKNPPDSRVCLTPEHCNRLMKQGFDVTVQPSQGRVFKNQEYENFGVRLQEDLTDRDILIGVKEVPIDRLIPNKTYFFFSHTFKKQVYNRGLLQAVLEKKITLIDYEAITNAKGARLIAFGKYAGIVGAHNGIYTYLKSKGIEGLPRMHSFFDYSEAKLLYKKIALPSLRIVLTGAGRVASGAAKVLDDMEIRKVSPFDFVLNDFDGPVYTQIHSFHYAKRKDGRVTDSVQDFYNNPSSYESEFHHFWPVTDLLINGIYWDNNAPPFFTVEDMKKADFRISTIADITCDIAPLSSIPSTIKASTIANPIFGFDPYIEEETVPFQEHVINMMTIDNLPNELPRDASLAFGDMFLEHVIPELVKEESDVIHRATISKADGTLNIPFEYLQSFVDEK